MGMIALCPLFYEGTMNTPRVLKGNSLRHLKRNLSLNFFYTHANYEKTYL
jgi:hypothetical protein